MSYAVAIKDGEGAYRVELAQTTNAEEAVSRVLAAFPRADALAVRVIELDAVRRASIAVPEQYRKP